MPKVLIREIDNSTTGSPATDNFAVVVPGYFGTPKTYTENGISTSYDADKDLWNASGVYEIKSQSDFDKYIGKVGGTLADDSKGPTLKVLQSGSSFNGFEKYFKKLGVEDFNRADCAVYKIAAEIDSATHLYGDKYGKNGHLLKTISYTKTIDIKNDDGEVIDTEDVDCTVTVMLEKVELANVSFDLDPETGRPITVEDTYCLIATGEEGTDKLTISQNGNQIAYELLGLGYTVLYKKLDAAKSLSEQLEDSEFWEPLRDKSVFNFRYIMTGGYYKAGAMNQIVKLANFINSNADLETSETLLAKENGRGDCIALCDLDEDTYNIKPGLTTDSLATNMGNAAAVIEESPYAAIFAPRVEYVMDPNSIKAFAYNTRFPASFHYLACAAKAFSKYNEWFAVAGYNRGVSKYDVANTSVKIGEILVNTLAPRVENKYTKKSINLILNERNNYFLWGNRTAKKLDTNGIVFHHFLNIRQLCCTIKKQLYTACRRFTFDPNSDLLWINFVNAIAPTLDTMRAGQGIKGYTITKVANDKKALLTARIRIVPIEAVEDFDISIYLEDSLTGIVVNANEEQA